MKVIINSDDFGHSVAINSATAESLYLGLISSTTLLVNKEGFEDAVHRICTEPVFKDKVGIHLNLTDGWPLTEKIKSLKRFCDSEGRFMYNRHKPCWHLNCQERDAIYNEWNAQVEKCVRNNIALTHIDSHHHVHTEWGIAGVAVAVAKKFGIKKVRISRNIGQGMGLAKRIYKSVYNRSLLLHGMISAKYCGDAEDFAYAFESKAGIEDVAEVVVHAMYNGEGKIVDYNQQELSPKILKVLAANQLIGYRDL